LVGRGGIGKTSLAISVATRLAQEGRFEAILWFSARDIDLLPEGPKVVAARVLSQRDIGNEFIRLLEPEEAKAKGFKAVDFLASSLTKSPTGDPYLFVFDNFETVTNPADLFAWLDMHIRLPNKILITSRYRDFKADFPIEVTGMTDREADQLMDATAHRLGIADLLTKDYRNRVFEEADGHPYIIKVLLGEVGKAGKLVRVERIVAGKDDILEALFERTYSVLHPVAKRVFLTLCGWRSLVPQLALEAVLLRPANDKMDVANAVEELTSSSLVEQTVVQDGTTFLGVPLVAAVFGRRKLEVTPMKTAIDADVEFLQQIGATSSSGARHGIGPRLEKLFQNVATRLTNGRLELAAVIPSLEFICRQYPRCWLMLANLHEELGGPEALARAAECFRRFLESPQSIGDQQLAWNELARLYQSMRDWTGAAQAQIRRCKLPDTPYSTLSNTANWLNSLLRENYVALDSEEKRVLYRELAELMERRASEATATDLSRLAWLYLHLRDVPRAKEVVEKGLALDPENEHCIRLKKRLLREPTLQGG
jgi:tetratricopeptide (TPR) repeat protein